ncbi:hypothetical protein BC938DRAFT_480450 [Jimgerdemannia flammicorona]|uniref:Uncharacterized protein n=1 Tax=Jimgerdemannia flammicorona TaxID=994334 RepID=A0A433QII3_9FUNG|nr:hypothetical protein BC938DRAFT_480450 [Jimgerdemannia flammicorona]
MLRYKQSQRLTNIPNRISNNEPCEGLARGRLSVGLGKDKVPVGFAAVSDPHLLTVDDAAVAPAHGSVT